MGSEQPLIGETIGQMFTRIARTYPDNEALVDVPSGQRYTYAEFHDVCTRAAKSLMALGVRKGDRVAVWATNHPEWVIAQFSTALIGKKRSLSVWFWLISTPAVPGSNFSSTQMVSGKRMGM